MPRFRQQSLPFPEVIHRAGDIGEHPPDGDRGPDTGDAERPCREIRERDARAERNDRQHNGHRGLFHRAVERVEEKQKPDTEVERRDAPEIVNALADDLRVRRGDEKAHKRLSEKQHHGGDDCAEAEHERVGTPDPGANAVALLRTGGVLVMEHDHEQGALLRAAALGAGFKKAETGQDLTGRDRYLRAVR